MGTLLFYSGDDRGAAIGTLTPSGFTTTKPFSPGAFSRWTHVVARGSLVLFYNHDTGSAAFGEVAPNSFVTKYEPHAGTFGRWTNIINTAAGWFFYDRMTGAAAVGTLLHVPPLLYVFETTASFAAGSLAEWTHIVADGQTVFFYNRLNGSGAIATVTATGMTTNVSFGAGSFGAWTHVVNHGPTLLFYNRDNGSAAIGTLTAQGFTTNFTYSPGAFGVWTHIVSDGATLLFYNHGNGAAAIGTLSSASFSTTTTYAAGQFGGWTQITGDSASGPEPLELKVAVLLCHWQRPPGLTTVLPAEYYRRYLFDLSNDQGVGRFWFDQSGGQLRFTGSVNDWISLSKAPSDPSIASSRGALPALAVADAQKAGWHPGNAEAVIVFVACDQAKGVNAGDAGQISIDGVNREIATLHADSANYVAFTNGVVDNFRFDFNCHEVGHSVGRRFSFGHAFGPNGRYDNPYCIMSAMSYGYLGGGVTYDPWTPTSSRLPEEHTKGPGLSGSTRAACGWARTRRVQPTDLSQPIELFLAHVDDHESSLTQVIECPSTINGAPTVFTIELRSKLAERDQGLPTAIVLCQREGSTWSSDGTWAPFSSTFVVDGVISSNGPLPSVSQSGVVRAVVIEVAPAETFGGRTAPPWVRIRLSKA